MIRRRDQHMGLDHAKNLAQTLLRELDRLSLEEQKNRERGRSSGPHRFFYYEPDPFDPDTQREQIPCHGCGEVRGHANHRADLVSVYGEEAYRRHYQQ
jgi:hypothetical protein